ncbi:hypothetical protein LCGC14_1797640 [marine sediment metagenome]|uniref:ABC-2 type transporter domain-containing protein n=1 Tax=marine sediment metagenome TaxID=412755 RepID=A0A0F9GQN4_9ZZZZ
MKRKNKINSSLFYEKNLFSFYLKKRILSIKFILCILFSILISLSQSFFARTIDSQNLEEFIFWQNFLGAFSLAIWPLYFPIIITADIVSGEFSNKFAMIIYSTESRTKILFIKLLCLIISIFILNLFYFFTFLIIVFIRTGIFVSMHIFLIGFLITFVEFLFISFLTFMVSALTRKTFVSFILPFFYINITSFLEYYELELLSYNSYKMMVISFFENLLFNEQIVFSIVKNISLIIFFGLPILIILITFYGFKQLDIRID